MGKAKLRQHDPVIAPNKWDRDERAFVISIEHLFDTIYQRVGELETKVTELQNKLKKTEETENADN